MSTQAPILLYVEDEPLVSMVVVAGLEEAGFRVEAISDGGSALVALERELAPGYVALITDVRLPGANGWTIARRARELHPALPVVYCSGDSAEEWSAKGVPNSIMIQKPFAQAQLIVAVTTLLNQAAVSASAA